jgi:hypothetical protein
MSLKPPSAGKVAFLLVFFSALSGFSQTDGDKFYQRAQGEFQRTRAIYSAGGQNASNCLVFARASFDLAEIATNATQRADVAQQGIAACRQLLAREANSAPAHYYLAENMGELADAEAPSLAAYKLVHEIEQEFLTAAKLDKNYDYAGAPRCLGLLYRDAPGWPLSIGSKAKARDWLVRAAVLAPDYPENFLNLAEAHLRWHEGPEADTALKKLDALWPSAQTNLTGVAWEKSWSDWTHQRTADKALLHKEFKHVP